MAYKLTLNIDKELAEQAKVYAKSTGRSLSDLVENYFKMLSRGNEDLNDELTPKVKALKGSIKVPKDFDYKKELADQLSKKYLKND